MNTCTTCDLPQDQWDPTDPLYTDGAHQCPDCTRADLDAEAALDHAEEPV